MRKKLGVVLAVMALVTVPADAALASIGTARDKKGDAPEPRGDLIGVAIAYAADGITVLAEVDQPEDPSGPNWQSGDSFTGWRLLTEDGQKHVVFFGVTDGRSAGAVSDDGPNRPTKKLCGARAVYSDGASGASLPPECIGSPSSVTGTSRRLEHGPTVAGDSRPQSGIWPASCRVADIGA